MTPEQAARLARSLQPQFYADENMLRAAAQNRDIANVVDNRSGYKADISVVPDDAYYNEVLSRRMRILPLGNDKFTWVVSAEDIILMKLIWRKGSGSRKQWDNAFGVVLIQGARLDWFYLRKWAKYLGSKTTSSSSSWTPVFECTLGPYRKHHEREHRGFEYP